MDSRDDGARGRPAGLLAAAADLGADPAVHVVRGVTLALRGAGAAELGAGLEDGLQRGCVGPGPARESAPSANAEVGAVLVQADALAKRRDRVLGQTGIGAGGAGLGPVEEGLDAGDEHEVESRLSPPDGWR